MLSSKWDFDNPNNYLFDPSEIEVLEGAKLFKKMFQAPEILKCHLNENTGLVAIDSIAGQDGNLINFLDENRVDAKLGKGIEGRGNGIISFGNILNFDSEDSFAEECWVKWTDVYTQILMGKKDNTEHGYQFYISGSKIRVSIKDTDGEAINASSIENLNDGNFHHVVFNYDGSRKADGITIFIDGEEATVERSGDDLTGSIINPADFQISGKAGVNLPLRTGTVIDECVVYSRPLTPEEVSYRYNSGMGTENNVIDYEYSTSNPSIKPFGYFITDKLYQFISEELTTGSDEIRYALEINEVQKYFDGTTWVVSNNYEETNTAAEINANADKLDISNGAKLRFIAYLHSEDSLTTPTLSSIEVKYDFAALKPEINKTIVYGFVTNTSGEGLENIDVEITLTGHASNFNDSILVASTDEKVTTNSEGRWEIELLNTEQMDGEVKYNFAFKNEELKINFNENREIPNVYSINYSELNEELN